MDLAEIVPFGRALAEYRAFFALSDQDLQARIVDCAAGPASFVAEAPRPALALDPIYALPIAGIRSRFAAVVDDIIDQVIATPERWVWHFHRNPADLRAHREAACER
ncbi:MAG: SAM-dependent methyltransferase, partial [Planctomycetota bacterium]|nr:SAM-dependent methyltransferase [Planctomycetota bacterium]